MAKQRDESRPDPAEIKRVAEALLDSIGIDTAIIEANQAQAAAAVAAIQAEYAAKVAVVKARLERNAAQLMAAMKSNKAVLFDGADVVELAHGSLIRNEIDKVKIPRNALESCKAQGFTDVIKTVESLDREAVEKWPDAKLTLIGAVRKPVEEFSYDLKKEAPCKG